MSKYIDADKLIHDLEERIFAYSKGYAEGDDNRKDAIETLLKDVKYQYSLQQEQPEKPVPNDLEEAAEISFDEARALTEGYLYFLAKGLKENHPRPIGPHWFCEYAKNRFIAGAKWQEKRNLRFVKQVLSGDFTVFEAGRKYERKQMMKEGVETEVWNYSSDEDLRAIPLFSIDKFNNLKEGDKVKLIIVKED